MPSPTPQVRTIRTLLGEDSGAAQQPLPVTIKGRPHRIFTDGAGSGGVQGTQGPCARGGAPYGLARVIALSDEKPPRVVSRLLLEVHDRADGPARPT